MFNARINSNKQIVTDGNQIEVGGDDRYVALCRKCYFEKTGKVSPDMKDLMLKANMVMQKAGIWEDIMSKPSKFE